MNLGYEKTIVCLANSRKPPAGQCVAGREVTTAGFGGWVRAVSSRASREVSLLERRYHDGRDPQVLDVISIRMTCPHPHPYQKENHVIDTTRRWQKRGQLAWADLLAAVEDPAGPLWLNGYSSYYGYNDRVPEGCMAGLAGSLYLVRPEQLRIVVQPERGELGLPRRRVRAAFNLCSHAYRIVVTDPWIEFDFLTRDNGETAVNEALLCISLSELYHGFAYKLAATVIMPPQ
jgi:hypothetical protein